MTALQKKKGAHSIKSMYVVVKRHNFILLWCRGCLLLTLQKIMVAYAFYSSHSFQKPSFKTHPLVPSIGSRTQCLPREPPSDLPQSMALTTSSVDKIESLYDPSLARISLTSFVMRS
jgi:hypothetical protein